MYAHVPVSPFPAGSFRPGRVIGAKVEGHDWWPARVVRRRAVPREVGPPPGGPARVRTQIPVVFFTAKGIPGEVGDDKQPSTPSGAPPAPFQPVIFADAGCGAHSLLTLQMFMAALTTTW